MGYYSLIGLLRLNCLFGDYYNALRSLDPIDLTKKGGMFSRVTACHITLYYYTGFAYLMMRRYADAIRTFSTMLNYLSRTEHHRTQGDQVRHVTVVAWSLFLLYFSHYSTSNAS